MDIYRSTCDVATSYQFEKIFSGVVDFLMEEREYPATKEDAQSLKRNFRFALCDQNNYHCFFEKNG